MAPFMFRMPVVAVFVTVAVVAGIVALVVPGDASAVGLPISYPRTVAVTGTGEGVRLTRMEVRARPAGRKVRVSVRIAGASIAGSRRIEVTVAPCAGSALRPSCRPAARQAVIASRRPFRFAKSFTIPKPAARPGALRVQVRATGAGAIPICSGSNDRFSICQDPRFALTGDVLLNAGAWRFRPGTWWGITALAAEGPVLDRVVFNSRIYGWVATSHVAAELTTTIGYTGAPAARTYATRLFPDISRMFDRTPRVGTAFGGARTTVSVLEYAAGIGAQRLFTVKVPLPRWSWPEA